MSAGMTAGQRQTSLAAYSGIGMPPQMPLSKQLGMTLTSPSETEPPSQTCQLFGTPAPEHDLSGARSLAVHFAQGLLSTVN